MEKRKILLTTDEEILAATEHPFFQRVHYDLLAVPDGEEAFSAIEAEDPVLVILSLDMPFLSGDDCCRRVKDDPLLRGTPVILVAPGDTGSAAERCRESRCDAVALRPLDPQELVTAACRLLGISERTEPRLAVNFTCRCGPSPTDLSSCRALDLNSRGMFIATAKLLPIDTEVTVEFPLPGESATSRIRGRIAWVNHPEWLKTPRLPIGMGIRFLDLSGEQRRTIQAFLGKIAPNNDNGDDIGR